MKKITAAILIIVTSLTVAGQKIPNAESLARRLLTFHEPVGGGWELIRDTEFRMSYRRTAALGHVPSNASIAIFNGDTLAGNLEDEARRVIELTTAEKRQVLANIKVVTVTDRPSACIGFKLVRKRDLPLEIGRWQERVLVCRPPAWESQGFIASFSYGRSEPDDLVEAEADTFLRGIQYRPARP